MKFHSIVIISICAIISGCNIEAADTISLGSPCEAAKYIVVGNRECADSSCQYEYIEKYGKCPGGTPVCAVDDNNQYFCHEKCEKGVFCLSQCIDPLSSSRFCGANDSCTKYDTCGHGETCINGYCKTIGNVDCGEGGIIDPMSSDKFCGADENCDNYETCMPSHTCRSGKCINRSFVLCDGEWIDPASDNRYCHAEENCMKALACKENQSCRDGQCIDNSFVYCDERWIDPMSNDKYCNADPACQAFTSCVGNKKCIQGECIDPNTVKCGDIRVNPKTDRTFCGADENCQNYKTCGENNNCVEGVCRAVLDLVKCGGEMIDPATSPKYCGADTNCENYKVCIEGKEKCMINRCCLAFKDAEFEKAALNLWDADHDGCISNDEAIAADALPPGLFADNKKLISVDDLNHFPNIKEIRSGTFSGCDGLTKINLDYITTITAPSLSTDQTPRRGAFEDCSNITDISMPALTSLGASTFSGCSMLTTVSMPALESIEDPADGETDSVYSINPGAFEQSPALKTVRMPAVKSIGKNAFKDCRSLNTVDFSSAVDINGGAFYGCSALDTIDLSNMPALKHIHDADTTHDNYAFGAFEKSGVTAVDHNGIISIGAAAFKNAAKLTSLTAENAQKIGMGAFYNCSELKTIGLPKVSTIEPPDFNSEIHNKGAFENSGIEAAGMPGIARIEANTFKNCPNLMTVSFDTVKFVDGGAFYHCSALNSADVPNITEIGDAVSQNTNLYGAFEGTALTGISLSEITSIGVHAFKDCHKIASASLPKVTKLGSGAFYNCTALGSVSVPNLVTIDDEKLINYDTIVDEFGGVFENTALTDFSGPLVEKIGIRAFRNAKKLKSVSFPKATDLYAGAFIMCPALKSVSMPELVTMHGHTNIQINVDSKTGLGTFENTALTEINFPNVTSVGNFVFKNNSMLKIAKFPKAVDLKTQIITDSPVSEIWLTTPNFIKYSLIVQKAPFYELNTKNCTLVLDSSQPKAGLIYFLTTWKEIVAPEQMTPQ